MISMHYQQTVIGELIIAEYQHQLCLLDYRHRAKREQIDRQLEQALSTQIIERDSPLLQQTRGQIEAYLGGGIKHFDLPLLIIGSDFQKQVWHKLCQIKYGQTQSYSQLAASSTQPQAVRTLANAIAMNKLNLIIPCHRVITKAGRVGKYAGGSSAKKHLLRLEADQTSNFKHP